MMFNVFNAVFNALGDSRKPLIFLTASSILNIFLNIYFITKLGMTVDGVAWATVISQGLAVIATVIVLVVKLRRMNITEPSKWFEGKVCRTIFRVAGPTILQQSVVAVGLLLMQSVINGFGSIAVAGYTAANKIDLMAILPMTNMGNAVSTFTAQNIGAGKKERVPQGLKAGLIAVVVTGLVIAALLVVFGNALVGLFVSGEGAEAVIEEGARYLKISSIFYFIFGAMNSLSGVLRGSGDMPRFLATTMTNFGVRIILSFTVAAHMGLYMVAWSTVIGWVVSFVLAAIFYRSGKWMKKELI
jgi:putative MATE family efflux protein